jgi:hypothetical protein
MKLTDQQIELAAKIRKIVSLAGMPGMDEVAIKLNCGPTFTEVAHARRWAQAFELAQEGGSAFELAAKLHNMR